MNEARGFMPVVHSQPTMSPAPMEGAFVQGPWLAKMQPMLERVASADIPVLLIGETGVGKEVLAELVHRYSNRAALPLVRLNCAALPEQLLESELFGYERGAFTGAIRAKKGLLEVADGGTVFLDEIGELPIATQAKLLRVIEQGMLLRLGDVKERPVNVRYIAATNRDIPAEVEAGRFRSDLLYRLNAFTLRIPPLRERRGEIEPLSIHLVAKVAERLGRPRPTISAAAADWLARYDWPGNVRELKNALERAVVLCDGTIQIAHLPPQLQDLGIPNDLTQSGVIPMAQTMAPRESAPSMPSIHSMSSMSATQSMPPVRESRELERESDIRSLLSERERIIEALNLCGGNQTRAAKMLGISRRTLISRLDRYSLPRPRKDTPG